MNFLYWFYPTQQERVGPLSLGDRHERFKTAIHAGHPLRVVPDRQDRFTRTVHELLMRDIRQGAVLKKLCGPPAWFRPLPRIPGRAMARGQKLKRFNKLKD